MTDAQNGPPYGPSNIPSTPQGPHGPSFEFYIEKRLDLFANGFDDKLKAHKDAQNDALLAVSSMASQAQTSSEKATQAAMAASKEAILKAEVAADKRFESLNEMRAMLNDTISNFLPRREAAQLVDALTEKIVTVVVRVSTLENRINTMVGETTGGRQEKGATQVWVGIAIAFAAAVAAAVAAAAAVYFSKR